MRDGQLVQQSGIEDVGFDQRKVMVVLVIDVGNILRGCGKTAAVLVGVIV